MYIVHVNNRQGDPAPENDVWWSYDVTGKARVLSGTPETGNDMLLDRTSRELTKHTPDKIRPFIKVKSEFDEETIYYALTYIGLPKELRLQYENELHETAENRENGLRNLKEIIQLENLEVLNNTMLLTILRSTKFDPKKSASKLKNFITHKRKLSKKLAAIDMDLVKTFFEDTPVGFLPYRDKHGRAIFYTRPYGLHFDKYSMEDFTTITLALVSFVLSFELTTTAGVVYFADCNVPSLDLVIPLSNVFRNCTPSILSFPLRVAKAEIFNEFRLMRWAIKCLQPIIPEKIYKRISFHGPYENLKKFYPSEILPEEFGGSMGPLSNEFFKQQLFDFIENLREEGKQICN